MLVRTVQKVCTVRFQMFHSFLDQTLLNPDKSNIFKDIFFLHFRSKNCMTKATEGAQFNTAGQVKESKMRGYSNRNQDGSGMGM